MAHMNLPKFECVNMFVVFCFDCISEMDVQCTLLFYIVDVTYQQRRGTQNGFLHRQ